MPLKNNISYSAIILSGGKSSRMGSDKGLVLLKGIPMIQHIINKLKSFGFSELIIVANNPAYEKFPYTIIKDKHKEKGPLGGLYAGLTASKSNMNIVISCDTPLIDEKIIQLLLNQTHDNRPAYISFNNKSHYLIGLYSKNLIEDIEKRIVADDLAVKNLLKDHDAREIILKNEVKHTCENWLLNVNNQTDLKRAEMKCKVVFFGMIAEKIGKDSDLIDLDFLRNEETLTSNFRTIYPELKNLTFTVAINEKIAEKLGEGQVEIIALLPPFAGG
jgi:molybdenum cofactor guanylyltransferase